MSTVCYIRVSSTDQNTDRQYEALPVTDKEFVEKASGSASDRPQLKAMLKYLREGDHVHVLSIDRLARNIVDLQQLVNTITGKGAMITFHQENMTFRKGSNEPTSEVMFNILESFAQFERSLIRERQREGIAAAKARGKKMGRPSKLTDKQKKAIVAKRRKGITPTKLAKEYGVSRGLIYNIIGEGTQISSGSRLPQVSSSKV